MAISAIKEWLADDKLLLLQGWARDGLTYEQIAHNMGIGLATLKEWRKKEPAIEAILKRSKEVVDYEVENALFKNAMEGNVTAQIFWLKNRRKETWREKVDIENKHEFKNGILDELLGAMKNDKDAR